MKLFYFPGASSLLPHIILREAGVPFELERVDLSNKTTASGADFHLINPKGYVPALQLDDGQVLTEGPAIVQYISDAYPASKLAPPAGTLDRARMQEHLNYISSELHKAFVPFYSPGATFETKAAARAVVESLIEPFEKLLSDGRQYLLGDNFTAADAYLFVVSIWTSPNEIDLAKWPNVASLFKRVAGRPKVREAMQSEGLPVS